MRILLIRHGDPDYVNDTLTEKGRREAALLAKRAVSMNMGECYKSPLGRAKDTATQVDLNKNPELEKAYPDVKKEGEHFLPRIAWDMVPGYWTEHEAYMDKNAWRETEVAKNSDLVEVYDHVIEEFDHFLAEHGYVREGAHYRVEKESDETVTFFCHFGISCVLLSHLWNVSPFVLWHSLALAPTSVTEVVTEEREQGTAYFRGLKVGDISHLYAGGEEPSFAARFCETYSNKEQRH